MSDASFIEVSRSWLHWRMLTGVVYVFTGASLGMLGTGAG